MSEDFVHVDQIHELLASFEMDRNTTLRVVVGQVVQKSGAPIPPGTPKENIELSMSLDEVERMIKMAFDSGIVSAFSRKN